MTSHVSTFTVGRRPRAASRTREAMSWGMVFLTIYTMVAIGRIQEAFQELAILHLGMVFGIMALTAWVAMPGSMADKVPMAVKPVKFVMLLLAISVVTVPIAVWPGGSFDYLTGSYIKTILLFLMVYWLCRSLPDVRRIMWGACLALTVLVLTGVLSGSLARPPEVVTPVNEYEVEKQWQFASKTYDPNDLALVLVMTMPLCLFLWSTAGKMGKGLIISMMLINLYGIVLTQSRGGFLALLVVGGLIMKRSMMSRSQKTAIVVLAVVVFGALAGKAYWDRIETIWNPQTEYDRTAGGRTDIWKTGVMLFVTHPWGVGLNGFNYAEGLSHGGKGKWSSPHNMFIQVAVELGLAGLIVFILLLKHSILQLRGIQRTVDVRAGPRKLGARIGRTAELPTVSFTGQGKDGDDTQQVLLLAASLEICLIGYAVGGFFLSLAYAGLPYAVLAMSLVTARLAGNLKTPEAAPALKTGVRTLWPPAERRFGR